MLVGLRMVVDLLDLLAGVGLVADQEAEHNSKLPLKKTVYYLRGLDLKMNLWDFSLEAPGPQPNRRLKMPHAPPAKHRNRGQSPTSVVGED